MSSDRNDSVQNDRPVAAVAVEGAAGRLAWDLLFAVLTCGAVALLFARFHSGPPQRFAPFSDMLNYYYPMTELVAGRLARGELPLWNPHLCSGVPLLATLQVGVFYPGMLFSLWWSPEVGLPRLVFVECVLAGLFAFAALRAAGRGAPGACAGAVVFVFACVIGGSYWSSHTATLVWFPLLLLAVEKISRGFQWRWWGLLAGATALQCLGGFPQYLAYSFLFIGPYALVRLLCEGRRVGMRRTQRTGAAMALAVVLGVGLAGVQLLPTLELVGESVRADDLSAAQVGYLVTADTGRLLANSVDPRPKLIMHDFGRGGGYLGIATLLLAALGCVAGRRRPETWLFVALALASLIVSNGHRGAGSDLYDLFARIPVVGGFRTPERLRVLVFFCAAALAARGLDAFAGGFAEFRGRPVAAVAAGLAIAGVSGAVAFAGGPGAPWRLLAALLLFGLALAAGGRRALLATAALAMLVLLVTDLWAATQPFRLFPLQTRWSTQYYTPKGIIDGRAIDALRAEMGNDRVDLSRFKPKVAAPPAAGLYGIDCYEPLVPAQWPRLSIFLARRGINATMARLSPRRFPALHDVASVRATLLPVVGPPGYERLDNEDALPRAYWVEHYTIASQAEAFAHIRRGDYDFQGSVILDRDPGWPSSDSPGRRVEAPITRYEPESVEIAVDPPRPALLVLTDTHYPGWRASVDGEPAEILLANGLYRAIALRAGRHRVRFDYEPRSLRNGARLSAVSALIAIGLCAGGGAARRRAARRAL